MTDDLFPEDGLPVDEERDAPIEIYFGNPTLDMGIATLPKILPRFWTLLVSNGERLNDRQYALLLQVLLLRNTQDYELRVGNLPMASSLITLERDKKILRRLGLVFTERIYYPTQLGKPPRMQAQRWDMRSLFFNLEQIAYIWKMRQNELTARWEAGGSKGRKPVYNLPENYAHEITLPGEVALDILKGTFYPVPAKWAATAQALLKNMPGSSFGTPLPTGLNKSGTAPTEPNKSDRQPTDRFQSDTPTGPNPSGTQPTRLNPHDHLLDDEDDGEEGAATRERVFAYFAQSKGDTTYSPTAKEREALKKLLADEFTFAQIVAGIDAAFARPSPPRFFTHCAAIARDLARLQQETRTPETRTRPALAGAPETREPEALEEPLEAALKAPDQPLAEMPVLPVEVIETNLARAVNVYRNAGREITGDLLARFRMMVARCDAAARSAGSTGGDWLADALTSGLGVAKPGNLLNYADAVLGDWIVNGRSVKTAKPAADPKKPRRAKPAADQEPGAHAAIRDYLEKHGGKPNGDPS